MARSTLERANPGKALRGFPKEMRKLMAQKAKQNQRSEQYEREDTTK